MLSQLWASSVKKDVVYSAKGENVTMAGVQGGPKRKMDSKAGKRQILYKYKILGFCYKKTLAIIYK